MKGLALSSLIALEYFFRKANVGLEDFSLEASLPGKIFPARPICLGRFIDVLKVGLLFFYFPLYLAFLLKMTKIIFTSHLREEFLITDHFDIYY